MGNESGEWIMHGMKWDNPAIAPWMWRAIIARRHDIVYGKFFDKKAGFMETACRLYA